MSDYEWHWYTGPRLYACKINANTESAFREAVRLFHLRYPGVTVYLTQGSAFGAGGSADASAGTHDGGGVVDVAVHNLTSDQADYMVVCLRTVGFAAWRRFTWQYTWPNHIHAVRIGDRSLASGAARQVDSYEDHRDGLAGNRRDVLNEWVGSTDWETYKLRHPLPTKNVQQSTAKPAVAPPPAPKTKGWFGMDNALDTERKEHFPLKAGQERVLPYNDKGWPSLITGPVDRFHIDLTVRGDLPAGCRLRIRAAQFDLDGKGNVKSQPLFGGRDASSRTSDGKPFEDQWVFNGSVAKPAKGRAKRVVRLVAVATEDCTLTYITTSTLTRKD